jgi:hypothetical protein
MTALAVNFVGYLNDNRKAAWENLVRVVFGVFMGGLVALLIALYSGVPIV